MSAPKNTRETLAKGALATLSIDEAASYAITDLATNEQGERIPIKHVADLMGLPLAVVYDIASGRRPPRARELSLIVRATRAYLPVDAIEHQIGRVGVRLPIIGAPGDVSVARASAACRAFGEFMEEYGRAGEDRRYTESEVARIAHEGEETCAAIMEVIAQLKAQAVTDAPRAGGEQ